MKISCYDKNGLIVNGRSIVFDEIKCVIRFMNKKLL